MKRINLLNPIVFYSLLLIVCVIIAFGLRLFISQNGIEPGNGELQIAAIGEEINVEIMSRNYIENTEFLLRAEIDGEQVGIVYFDDDGKIQFDGDKERFEYALYKAFKLRGYGKKEDY